MILQQIVSSIYEGAVKLKRNFFMFPAGKASKEYIDEFKFLIVNQ